MPLNVVLNVFNNILLKFYVNLYSWPFAVLRTQAKHNELNWSRCTGLKVTVVRFCQVEKQIFSLKYTFANIQICVPGLLVKF
jgi:hypothetical protein